MIILGIDPGIATTGYGVIRKIKNQRSKVKSDLKHIAHGVIKTDPELPGAERLRVLYNKLDLLIKKYRPKFIAVEKLYFFKNAKTIISVAQAKGVILLAAAKKKTPVFEFTPLQVKMVVTGYGRAEKKQVQEMIKTLLDLKEIPKPDDAADALGVAICYARKLKR